MGTVGDTIDGGWRSTLVDAVDACAAADPTGLDDAQLASDVALLSKVGRRLEGLCARLVAEQARRRPEGRVTSTRALKSALGLSGGAARALGAAAEAIRALPSAAGEALAAGAISAEHVRALHGAGSSLGADTQEALLADAAREDPDDFRRRVLAVALANDGDDGAAQAARQRAARTAWWRIGDDGLHELRARLAPDDGGVVRTALQRLMDERWRAEHPERSRQVAPRDPFGVRLADALVDLARGVGAGRTPSRARAVPSISVLVDFQTLRHGLHDRGVHEDEWGNPLSPATIRRLACEAGVIPIVLGERSVPIDVGRRRRSPSAAQRAAVVARDRHCTLPGCSVPAAWCQVHHIAHWTNGGPTNLSNLILVCHEHHHLVHEGGWRAIGPAESVRFVSPDGAELRRRERRPP
jgi:hypothetical protein